MFPVNVKDNAGQTPAHLAAKHGRFDVYFFLVRNGADVSIQG